MVPMDCTGLGALIALRNLARARNGGVRLLNPTPTVQRLFDVVRAGEIFEIVNTRPTERLPVSHHLALMLFGIPQLLQQRFVPRGVWLIHC